MEVSRRRDAKSQEILDGIGIDRICEMIADDMSYREIAAKIGVSKSVIGRWIAADPGRLACAHGALKESAQVCDAKALEVLQNIPEEPTTGQVAKAREIAQHYRWRAKARNPSEYGDKVEVSGEFNVNHRDPTSLETALSLYGILAEARKRLEAQTAAEVLPSPPVIQVEGNAVLQSAEHVLQGEGPT